jgi:hypothetical protein
MQIDLTPGEAQALADLMDREVRLHGIQAAALYGGVLRQMIEKAKEEDDGSSSAA